MIEDCRLTLWSLSWGCVRKESFARKCDRLPPLLQVPVNTARYRHSSSSSQALAKCSKSLKTSMSVNESNVSPRPERSLRWELDVLRTLGARCGSTIDALPKPVPRTPVEGRYWHGLPLKWTHSHRVYK